MIFNVSFLFIIRYLCLVYYLRNRYLHELWERLIDTTIFLLAYEIRY
ncbi:hypothetical protein NTHI1209_01300 [Haemophilus influenzae]|uniref:Uncharacterized protein n=1 Tax=Haemophilus influenzae TaxID=727 RepID=A0A158SXU8_HAEIF|nr:hypothetical protein NTHI1209_01300 [Haemophilus influenzae]